MLRQCGPDLVLRRPGVARGHQMRHQPVTAYPSLADHYGLLDRADRGQPGLDLSGLDPVAVDLDLEVAASGDLDGAVRPVTTEVTGVVQAFTTALVEPEPFGGPLVVRPVTAGQPSAGGADFAGHPVRAIHSVGVDYVGPVVPVRPTIWDHVVRAAGRVDRMRDVPDGGFGGTAERHEPQVGLDSPERGRQVRRYPVSAHHDQA